MRQTKLSEYANGSKLPRVTRGNSDLPKEESQPVQSVSSSEEEEESNNPPKQKKIHHMTLKAIQRKRKLAEEAAALGISLEPKPEIPKIPKKRGRPKGYRVKKVEERDQFQIKEPPHPEKESTPEKKEFALRKRDPNKKIVDQDSEALQRELEQMELEKERENQEEPPMPMEIQKPPPKLVEAVVPPPAPKKRGRKKKVVVQATNPAQGAQQAALKLFTVPKMQTYDNYNKYYAKLMEVKKEETEQERPLIFNKFMDQQGYEKLLKSLK